MKNVTFNNVLTIKNGKNQKQVENPNGRYPIYGSGGIMGYADDYICSEDTVVIGRKGNINKPLYVDEPFWNVDTAFGLEADRSVLLPKYLYYYCLRFDFERLNKAVTIPSLTKADLLKIEMDLPDLDIQEEIADRLGRIECVMSMREQELQKLDELIKARFVEMFGDPITNPHNYRVQTLQQLIDTGFITYHLDGNHGGDYPRSEEFVDSGVPYIGANCIVNGEIDFSIAKHLTEERAGRLRKGIAHNEDVLFAHNATVGPTVVLHTELPKVILSTSLTAYRCNQDLIKPNYLKAYMQSEGFVRQYSGEMKQTTRNQVPITAQKKYKFLVPPLEEQEQFASFVEQVDKSKVAIQKSLEETQLLFDSLMQEYFG